MHVASRKLPTMLDAALGGLSAGSAVCLYGTQRFGSVQISHNHLCAEFESGLVVSVQPLNTRHFAKI